jgi:hypothetical protein
VPEIDARLTRLSEKARQGGEITAGPCFADRLKTCPLKRTGAGTPSPQSLTHRTENAAALLDELRETLENFDFDWARSRLEEMVGEWVSARR